MSFFLAQQDNDLLGRIAELGERIPFALIPIGAICLLALLQLALSPRAFWLIPIYLVMCMFSGHSLTMLDTGSTLVRWWLILCFCLSATQKTGYPGKVCEMLGWYWSFSLVSLIWSPNISGGIQLSGLSLAMTAVASRGISGLIPDIATARRVILWYLLMAVVFVANGLLSLGSMRGARFAGGMGEAVALFVITGGLLMPALLWGYHSLRGNRRSYCLVGFGIVSGLCLVSGQRTGFYAGSIACLPFIVQFQSKYLSRGASALLIAVACGAIAIQFFPEQASFLAKRYLNTDSRGTVTISTDTTGRENKWLAALEKINENPVIGYGAAADQKSGIGGFHNAYLQEWYNGGAVGMFLFFGASVLAFSQTFRLMTNRQIDPKITQMGRLLFCWMIALFLASFFESKLASPSNIMAFTMVLISVLSYRLQTHSDAVLRKIAARRSKPNNIDRPRHIATSK